MRHSNSIYYVVHYFYRHSNSAILLFVLVFTALMPKTLTFCKRTPAPNNCNLVFATAGAWKILAIVLRFGVIKSQHILRRRAAFYFAIWTDDNAVTLYFCCWNEEKTYGYTIFSQWLAKADRCDEIENVHSTVRIITIENFLKPCRHTRNFVRICAFVYF